MKQYTEKILIAWGEAISGNSEIRDWLMKNGYPELGLFCFALHFNKEATQWLMKSTPHLLATIHAVEGNKSALQWLKKNHFSLLYKLSKAADGNKNDMIWLMQNDPLFAILSKRIKKVKDEIEEKNNDVHHWG